VPSLRYWVHLVAPGWNVIGGGEPEIPGVSIGHNDYGAWGLTVFETDGEDLYVYKTNPANSRQYWYRGGWFDNLGIFWRQFTGIGKLPNRTYEPMKENTDKDVCSLAAHVNIPSGESARIKFVLSWSFPNAYNYWNPEKSSCGCSSEACCPSVPHTWKNYYATLFKDSSEAAAYCLGNWDRLYEETMLYKAALFSSTLPEACIDAVSANISILKTPTCLRLEDGAFYGWEGCNCSSGCCEGSCTHVWNYAYALPFLFPKLERSMRDLDFRYNQGSDGGMSFRLQLPPGRSRSYFRHARMVSSEA
jgi:uncharacterized protein (DUF608 family)